MASDPYPLPATSRSSLLVLCAFLLICAAVSVIGGVVTARSVGDWYPALRKPSFTPPDGVFAPVWTVLYAMMAVAAWRVWRRVGWSDGRNALGLFFVQLALNLAWSVLFFGMRSPGAALIDIGLLCVAVAATTVAFFRIDRLAGALLLPYLLWVGFAALLNASIWLRN